MCLETPLFGRKKIEKDGCNIKRRRSFNTSTTVVSIWAFQWDIFSQTVTWWSFALQAASLLHHVLHWDWEKTFSLIFQSSPWYLCFGRNGFSIKKKVQKKHFENTLLVHDYSMSKLLKSFEGVLLISDVSNWPVRIVFATMNFIFESNYYKFSSKPTVVLFHKTVLCQQLKCISVTFLHSC